MKTKYLVDLHIHSKFSDGKLTIAEIVDLYGSKGFGIIAITDHLADSQTLTGYVTQKLKLSLSKNNIDAYLSTILRESKRAWRQYGMILIVGTEITLNSWSRQNGAHFVLLGIENYIDPNQSIETILTKSTHEFSIAAHPLWEKSFEFKTTYLWQNREHLSKLFNAWECGTAQFFSKEVYLSGYPIVASSDFHGPTRFESWKTAAYLEELSTECLYDSIGNRQVEPIWM